jgi:diketogulonate reductase-like aldo/keto reductase
MLDARGQPVDALKQKVLNFFRKERGNTPAKIIATWPHEDGMTYPAANAIEGSEEKIGVPQFKLRPAVTKVAVLIRSIG